MGKGFRMGLSPPVRGRGLKPEIIGDLCGAKDVAPRAGAWIETGPELADPLSKTCRPPCGGVD